MNARLLPVALVAVATLASAADPTPITPAAVNLGRPVDFESDILPALEDNCIACHNLAIDEGKLSLEDVESILKGGKRGPAVVPGKPDESPLFVYASHTKNPIMPPAGNKVEATPLTPKQLGLVRQWIVEGAKQGMGNADANLVWSPLPDGFHPVHGLALTPWADTVVVGRANRVILFDTATGSELARLTDPAIAALQADGKPVYGQGIAHRDFAHAISVSPSGNRIATAGYRVVKIWERVARAAAATQNAGGPVTALAVSTDGKWVAIGSEDKSIRLWNVETNQIAHTLAGHEAAVTGLAFAPDASKLVSASKDKSLRIWTTADGKQAIKLDLPQESNDLCLTEDGTHAISADADNKLRVWALPAEQPMPEKPEDAPKPVRELAGHGGPVTCVVLIAGNQVLSGGKGGQVRHWDASNGRAVRGLNHGSPVTSVAVSPDGKTFASAAESGTAKLWRADNGQQIAETAKQPEASRNVLLVVEEQTVAKQKVALADAAQKAAEKNLEDRKKALETATKAKPEAEKKLKEAQDKLKPLEQKVAEAKKALEGKPDDNNLKNNVNKAEAEAQKQRDEVTKATTALDAANRAIDLAGKSVKTAETRLAERKAAKTAADAHQKQVDANLETAKKGEAEAPKPLRSVGFTAGGQLVTGGDDNRLAYWTATGTFVSRTQPAKGVPAALATLPDGRLLVGSADKSTTLLAASETWKLARTLGPQGDDPMAVGTSRFAGRVLALDFAPDGKHLATGGGEPSRSGEVLIWDVESGAVVKVFTDAHSDAVFDVEFSHDGQWLVTGAADKFAKLFDVAKGTFVRSYEGHTHHVLGVSIKADNGELVTAGADQQIKVWNLETGEQKRTIKNYAKEVTSIDYIGVGENTLSGGGDKSVRLHRTSNGQNYRTLSGNGDFVYATAAARDETILVSGGADGVVRIWDKNGQLKATIEPPKPATETTASN